MMQHMLGILVIADMSAVKDSTTSRSTPRGRTPVSSHSFWRFAGA
jgi:hypothetical protein